MAENTVLTTETKVVTKAQAGWFTTSSNTADVEVSGIGLYVEAVGDCVVSIDRQYMKPADLREIAEFFNNLADHLETARRVDEDF